MSLNTIKIGHGDFGQAGKGGYAGDLHSSGGWGTYSGRRIRIDPANPADAFNEAMDRIAGTESTLWVSAGTSPYDFNAIAAIDQPCSIIFDRNAQITKEPGNRTCFQVAAPGVSLIGLRVGGVVDATAPTAQSYVEVISTAGEETAADCLLEDCVFDVTQSASNVQGFFAVRAVGFGSTSATRGIDLRRCIYLARVGTQNAWGWVGEETSGQNTNQYMGTPYGCGLLFAKQMRDVTLSDCKIMGKASGTPGQFTGVQVILEDCIYGSITGLRMTDFTTVCSAGVELALPLMVIRGVVGEGGHTNIVAPFVEAVTARHMLVGASPEWINVFGGEMGRTGGSHLASAIKGYNAGGYGGNGFRVFNFATHNVFGPSSAGVAAGVGPVAGALLVDMEGFSNPAVAGCGATFRNDSVNPYRIVSCVNPMIGQNWHQAL